MQNWQYDQVLAMTDAKDPDKIFEQVVEFSRSLGFDYCAFGLRVPNSMTQPRMVLLNNYPEHWKKRYLERNYLAVDPSVRHCTRSVQPVVWSEALFSSTPALWDEAREHGLRHGWAQSMRDFTGALSMFTLARSDGDLGRAELARKTPEMSWLAQVAHTVLSAPLKEKLAPDNGAKLTFREVEILRWTADGKTSADIADILGLTERTVNFHINNVVAKLGAANRTAAVVRALTLGLLL
ncbi:LuxR family transcriptional regulator [Chitinimonas koreensis]|uniref:LuxR family transcriptional regulator n=1 Tax=Chitinimonas koreensis TaxID=356302 RepID=UPI000402155A|nr:LuxR family transcriptional regulator [Chitinimonas koreensis]QNM95668.1 LuxR family transcriptional regulator [Chitinimonas koreensis]